MSRNVQRRIFMSLLGDAAYRAQSRVSVSQALDRIRKVAKEGKKERFLGIIHALIPGAMSSPD
jgi:hypothetical protein